MKKLLLAAAWVWIAHSQAGGQVSTLFQNLNFSQCTSGYFWTQSDHPSAPPDGSFFAEIDPGDASYQHLSIKEADINPEDWVVLDSEEPAEICANMKSPRIATILYENPITQHPDKKQVASTSACLCSKISNSMRIRYACL